MKTKSFNFRQRIDDPVEKERTVKQRVFRFRVVVGMISLFVKSRPNHYQIESRVCVFLKWLRMVLIPLSCSGKGLIAMEGMETLET